MFLSLCCLCCCRNRSPLFRFVTTCSEKNFFFCFHRKLPAMPRAKREKSAAKQTAMASNIPILAWRRAAKELGYLVSGNFKPIPLKGTPEHAQIKARQTVIAAEMRAERAAAASSAAPPAPQEEHKGEAKVPVVLAASVVSTATVEASQPQQPQGS
jgi:hypothetical protein